MKLLQTIEEIFGEENVSSAIKFLQKKNNTAGDDGVRLHDLEEYWSINKEAILASIQTGSYEPQIVHEKIIVQANGKHRKISLFSSVDRLILRILQQSLQPIVDGESSQYSFAYQIGKGIVEAVKCAASFIECGKEYVVELDVRDFFEYINHDRLLHILRNKLEDSAMKRYENLNLDMADIFKPVIVDRVIFRMIHKRMISADEHFQKDDCGGTFLNEQGKRIMLEALEWKLKQVVTVDGKPYTYERLLGREVQNLEQSLIEGKNIRHSSTRCKQISD